MSIDIKNIAILIINDVDYRCFILGISKSKARNLFKNADLGKKGGFLKNVKSVTFFFRIIKLSNKSSYFEGDK